MEKSFIVAEFFFKDGQEKSSFCLLQKQRFSCKMEKFSIKEVWLTSKNLVFLLELPLGWDEGIYYTLTTLLETKLGYSWKALRFSEHKVYLNLNPEKPVKNLLEDEIEKKTKLVSILETV